MFSKLAGIPATFVGTAHVTLTRVYMTNPITGAKSFAYEAAIKNRGGTNELKIYVPGSSNPITAEISGGVVRVGGPLPWVDVATTSSTTDYEIVAGVA